MPDSALGIDFIAQSDQGGRPDGVQVMVHRGYAYIGHTFSGGFSIVDVRDPKNLNAVGFVAAPPNTRSLHLRTHDALLLAINAQDTLRSSGIPRQFNGHPARRAAQSRVAVGARRWGIGGSGTRRSGSERGRGNRHVQVPMSEELAQGLEPWLVAH